MFSNIILCQMAQDQPFMISWRFFSMSVNCWIISAVTELHVSISPNDSSSLVAGDESSRLPVCGRANGFDEFIESSWLLVGQDTSSLEFFCREKYMLLIQLFHMPYITYSYKLGSDFGRFDLLLLGEVSLYDSLRVLGCAVFCLPFLLVSMTWSVLSFAWLLCGEDEIKLADPPDEPATVLLDPWLVKSDWDELSLRLGNWSCDALLEDNEGLWNWMSPFGLALNDWERSMIRKSMKIIWLFYKLSSIYWEINFQSEKIEKQWKTARVNFFCLFIGLSVCCSSIYVRYFVFYFFSLLQTSHLAFAYSVILFLH